jgi:hypothetical protein
VIFFRDQHITPPQAVATDTSPPIKMWKSRAPPNGQGDSLSRLSGAAIGVVITRLPVDCGRRCLMRLGRSRVRTRLAAGGERIGTFGSAMRSFRSRLPYLPRAAEMLDLCVAGPYRRTATPPYMPAAPASALVMLPLAGLPASPPQLGPAP